MPWTETARRQYRRDGLRYAGDLTDAEWALVEPFMPKPSPVGRPRSTNLAQGGGGVLLHGRDGMPVAVAAEGIFALFDGAGLFLRLVAGGLWATINPAHVMTAREKAPASSTASR